MVASTDIKWFTSTNLNAPQLSNAWGVMIDVLDACLITGINIGTVSTLTASGATVTATFGTAHGVSQYQVIQISGANQGEYNGEHRATTVTSTTITFELASAPVVTTATGTIAAKLAPAGWEKSFSGTNKAAYRSLNTLLPSRPYLRVDNSLDPAYTTTYAKYAKVGIVETMTGIDTMSGVQAPYDAALPDKNWVGTGSGTSAINGWAKWYYARNAAANQGSANDTVSPATGDRQWLLVGNGDYFYILPSMLASNNVAFAYGFGSFNSLLNTDSSNVFLSATLQYVAANGSANKQQFINIGISSTANSLLLLQRGYAQNATYSTAGIVSLYSGESTSYSGTTDNFGAYSLTNIAPFAPIFINETVLRGEMPSIYYLFQQRPYGNLQVFENNGELYIAKNIASSTTEGQIILKIGGL